MWLDKDTKKPVSLRKLLQKGFSTKNAIPEPLSVACLITHGLNEKRLDWVLKLEDLGSEADMAELERRLKTLLNEIP
jgi:hypothetical protein